MVIEHLDSVDRALVASWLEAHGGTPESVLRAEKAFRMAGDDGQRVGVLLVSRYWFAFVANESSALWPIAPMLRAFYIERLGILNLIDFNNESVERINVGPIAGQSMDDILCSLVADGQIPLDRRWLKRGDEQMLAAYMASLQPDESVMGAEIGTSAEFKGKRSRGRAFLAYTGRRLSAFSEATDQSWQIAWSELLELTLGRPRRHSELVRVLARSGESHEFVCRNDFARRLAFEHQERRGYGGWVTP